MEKCFQVCMFLPLQSLGNVTWDLNVTLTILKIFKTINEIIQLTIFTIAPYIHIPLSTYERNNQIVRHGKQNTTTDIYFIWLKWLGWKLRMKTKMRYIMVSKFEGHEIYWYRTFYDLYFLKLLNKWKSWLNLLDLSSLELYLDNFQV